MIEEALKKHVIIGVYGRDFEGFLDEISDKSCRLIQIDNDVILIKRDFISFCHIRTTMPTTVEKKDVELEDNPIRNCAVVSKNNFSMPLNTNANYQFPEFIRETEKK